MLFERCTAVVLGSPYLLDRASLHLPHRISYFLLYLALESRNQLAVEKLVAKWPHADLTLDFLSQQCGLIRRHVVSRPHFLEPHEYMGLFGSYARYSSADIVSSLLEGVFYNLYNYHGLDGSQGLRHMDMSAVIINPKQLPLLLSLVRGSVPVTHYSDYVNDREAQILGITRPTLHKNHSHQPPLNLLVNILLDNTATNHAVSTLSKVCSLREWVEVKLKGMNLLHLRPVLQTNLYPLLNTLLSSITDHVYLSDPSMWQRVSPFITPSSVWLCSQGLSSIPVPLDCRDLLYVTSEPTESLAVTLSQLTIQPRNLRALCLMLGARQSITKELSKALDSLLRRVCCSLQSLQLCYWGNLTTHNLESLQTCCMLRVLSISNNIYWPESLFEALSKLPLLEYLHWHGGELLSPDNLLSLNNSLCDSFKSLCHFHLECTNWEELDPSDERLAVLGPSLLCLLKPLLENKSGERIISAEILEEWLSSLRPDVCIKVWDWQWSLVIPQLCQAVAMDNMHITVHNYSKYM